VWRGRDIHLVVQRARIALQAHEGHGTEEIARVVGWRVIAVRKWKTRFESAPALDTLNDAARSGRPSTVPLSIRCQLVRLASERPNHEIMRFRDGGRTLRCRTRLRTRPGTASAPVSCVLPVERVSIRAI
jgi:transposase